MTEPLSNSAIVQAVAREAANRATRRVITQLQRLNDTLSGDDSELENVWDEICVQLQDEESVQWDAYEETVRMLVETIVEKMPQLDRQAIWMQTDAGFKWDGEDPTERDPYPVSNEDIVGYIIHEHVYEAAGRWSNKRIRAFIDRSSERD
jgi:hypothetical protein